MERDSQQLIKQVIDLNYKLVAAIWKLNRQFTFEVYDKSTNTCMLSEKGIKINIFGLNDGKFVKINDKRISLMNENLEI